VEVSKRHNLEHFVIEADRDYTSF